MRRCCSILRRSFALLLVLSLAVGGLLGLWRAIDARRAYQVSALTDTTLASLELSHTTHLMIVAHPDDETLWGGAHLAEGGYLVVCITNGTHPIRKAEFQSVMQASGNTGLILSYPDKVGGRRDNWAHVRTQLTADLTKIMTYQPWDDIVTHNAAGEYGHIHHKMTHQIVTSIYDKNALSMPLYVFGTYYRAKMLPDVSSELTVLSDDALSQKEFLLSQYVSQSAVIASLSHMNPYEMWKKIRNGGTAT